MHSVFSDGLVWPTVRVDEAYRDGLDAISLTEHIEYRPHKQEPEFHSGVAPVHSSSKWSKGMHSPILSLLPYNLLI